MDIGTRIDAEAQLGELAGGLTPEGFRKVAHQLMAYLDSDGTLACGCDNRLVNTTPTGWTTRQRKHDNRTEWIPPPHLDRIHGCLTTFGCRGQTRINDYHHPERLLRPDEDRSDADHSTDGEPA